MIIAPSATLEQEGGRKMLTRSPEEIIRIIDETNVNECSDAIEFIARFGGRALSAIDTAWIVAAAYKIGKADAIAAERAKRRAMV